MVKVYVGMKKTIDENGVANFIDLYDEVPDEKAIVIPVVLEKKQRKKGEGTETLA